MSETVAQALPPIPPATAEAYARMAPETATAAHSQLKAAGYDVSKLAQGVVTAPAVPVPGVAPDKPRLDQASANRWLDLYKHFSGDKAEVVKAGLASGIDILALQADAATAPIIAAQKRQEALAAALEPAEEYKLDYGKAATQIEDLAGFNANITTGFKAMSVPSALAQPLLDAIMATAALHASKLDERYATVEDRERELVAQQIAFKEQGARIKAMSDPDIVRLAELAIAKMPKAFHDGLYENFSLHSAETYAALAAVGRAVEARKAKV